MDEARRQHPRRRSKSVARQCLRRFNHQPHVGSGEFQSAELVEGSVPFALVQHVLPTPSAADACRDHANGDVVGDAAEHVGGRAQSALSFRLSLSIGGLGQRRDELRDDAIG